MKELPILFSTPMVQAIQENRKTMTRRTSGLDKVNEFPDEWTFISNLEKSDGKFKFYPKNGQITELTECKPRYQVGDHIWVRETFLVLEPEHCEGMSDRFHYKTIHTEMNEDWRLECISNGYPYKWKPSLFMPKEAARIYLECTGVRCERLLYITGTDAISEGILPLKIGATFDSHTQKYFDYSKSKQNFSGGLDPIWSFKSLWCSINGDKSWDDNPWVFIYEFKKLLLSPQSSASPTNKKP